MDKALGNKLIDLRARIVEGFDGENWEELGLLTGATDLIMGHYRLLRSLGFGDEDYAGHALTVLRQIVEADLRNLPIIEEYLDRNFPRESTYISAKPSQRRITFAPNAFQVPDGYAELDLVAVMMPFSMEFTGVYEAIKQACLSSSLRCLRADDIWEESTIIQDIFNLIFRAQIVVVDFTGKNPNVMYETGIAHTLGKHVIPISQSLDDVPFDMRHHRVLKYLPNKEGLTKLSSDLAVKLSQFKLINSTLQNTIAQEEDDIPF
jgi:hypothetical protein